MNWSRFIPSGRQVADVATSKAAQAAAGAVVDRFGPHRTLSKIGTVMILIGVIVLVLSWVFLTSWAYWVVTVCGAGFVGAGYALRGFNSLIVSLLSRCLKAIGKRIYSFVSGKVQAYRAREAAKRGEVPPAPSGGAASSGETATPPGVTPSGGATPPTGP